MNAPLDPSVMGDDSPRQNAPGRPSEGPTAALEATGGLQVALLKAPITLVRAKSPEQYRKGYSLNQTGDLVKRQAKPFFTGQAERPSYSLGQLAELLRGDPPSQTAFLMCGLASEPKRKMGKWEDGMQHRRSAEEFPFPDGAAFLVVDSDGLDHWPTLETPRDVVLALDGLGLKSDCVTSSSASSYLAWPNGGYELRGLHTWAIIDRGTEIPRVLEALHVRACLAGYGRIQIATNGVMHVRSIVDMALGRSCQPIYEWGAILKDERITQARQVEFHGPEGGSDSRVLEADSIPPLTDDELARFAEWEREEKAKLQGEADRVREAWLDGQVARLPSGEQAMARKALEASLEKEHRDLPPWYEITLKDGSTMTVGALLEAIRDNPGKWHGKTLPDPCEPDYRDGACCATVFCKDQKDGKAKILSMAHGVSSVYHLEPRKEAHACSSDDFADLSSGGAAPAKTTSPRSRPAEKFPESVTVDEAGGKTHRRPEHLSDEALQVLNEIADAAQVGYGPESEEAREIVRRSLDLADVPSQIYAQAYLHKAWRIPIEKVRELVREIAMAPLAHRKQPGATSFCEGFSDMCVTDDIASELQTAVHLIPNLIIRGQVTAIIARPNGGKTTIMIHHCEELVAMGFKVLYFNMDGNGDDIIRHRAHARQHGYDVVSAELLRKSNSDIVSRLHGLVAHGASASGTVLIFDTVKKLVDMIHKAKLKALLALMRRVTYAGGTVVLIGHANKNPGADGSMVFEGTGDLKADIDMLIYMESELSRDGAQRTVITRPDKVRGTVVPRAYTITLPDRVVTELEEVPVSLGLEGRVWDAVVDALRQGFRSQREIVSHIVTHASCGRDKAMACLANFVSEDQRLSCQREGKGYVYALRGEDLDSAGFDDLTAMSGRPA